MQRNYPTARMQRQGDHKYVTDDHLSCKLGKVFGGRRYSYSPPYNISEVKSFTSSQSEVTSTPGYGGFPRCEPVCRGPDPFQPMRAQHYQMNYDRGDNSTEIAECDWALRTLLHLTFSSNRHDSRQIHKTTGHRYRYASPSEVSGFRDELILQCMKRSEPLHLEKIR